MGYGRGPSRFRLRTAGTALLLAGNLASLLSGVIYGFADAPGSGWNLYGVLLLLTLLGNLHIAMGRGVHRGWEYGYLALHVLGLAAVPVWNTVSSSSPGDTDSRSVISTVIMLALFAYGAVIAFLRLQNGTLEKEDGRTRGYSPYGTGGGGGRLRRILKGLLTVWFLLNLVLGLYLCAILLGGVDPGLLEVILPEYALFFGLMFLGAAALLVKMYGSKKGFWRSTFRGAVRLTGLLILLVCALPLASAPKIVNEGQEAYTQAFGEDPTKMEDDAMMRSAFLLPDYFYGARTGDYRVKTDIVYYEGTEGKDAGRKLAFDVYMPPADAKNLPGQNSVLIRVHGGGWTIGDKGAGNYAQMNKYFASRGYVVFDVQYGLSNTKKFVESAVVPEQVVGDFDIGDMVRHIGLFTTYMVEHADEYGANTKSVFFSGGSAGGQLAAAAGLAPANPEFKALFDPGMTVKGIIPYYPANGLAKDLGIGGADGLSDPSLLVTADSPPALIYQGVNDGIVDVQVARDFAQAYREAGSDKVALVEMPFGTHGSDIYFPSYYNEPFTYLMERFMRQYR
ncbi:alpha/beta hydrolase [Saccharibacillus deserti]|uniref:alpha/beta hydrolase n=1 Tax=Saccharibacillus deserti TaxID=1634444 RepID=UPI00155415B9|nr:alpha/beta hydrolase fold domain-containing protein [Saccharibacillus deserti]